MSDRRWALHALAVATGVVMGAACSASSGQDAVSFGPGTGGDTSVGGSNPFGQGGVSAGGDTPFGGSFGGFGTPVGGGGDAAVCGGTTYTGERLPLDMYFVIDQSGSMNEKTGGGNTTKWSAVTTSLTAFLNDPANADIGVGSEYFPLVLPGVNPFCTVDADCKTYGPCVGGIDLGGGTHLAGTCQQGDACNVADYIPSVPLVLPPNHQAVVSDMANHGPGGGTPTAPALQGAVNYVQQWMQNNPGRKTVIVLATDGDPTGCTANAVQDVANIASAAAQKGIQTFVIGVGNSLTSLNQIAQAGGTGQAYIVDTGGNVQQQFSAALAAIHGAALPCNFTIPTNGQADPNKVNITFTSTMSATPQIVPQASDSSQCPANGPAWYYSPDRTQALLCDATCGYLKQVSATVNFQIGCTTVTVIPH